MLNPAPLSHTLLRKARSYSRKLWVRVAVMGLLSFVALGLAQLVEPFVPERLATSLTGTAADRLLQIIANAMLAVTIFSLTVMVSVYQSASNQWTPRVHRLIMQDRTTQNTLAVFIGAYVYALLAIILRELGIFGDSRAFVLFVMTVLVLSGIVFNLIRWVLHLQTLGSLINTTRQIEDATLAQFKERLRTPCLGARPLVDGIPKDAMPIGASQSGYVQVIHPEALDDIAKSHGVTLYFAHNIGSFVFVNEPLVKWIRTGDPNNAACTEETLEKHVRASITLGDLRTYEQDPRFGLIVLGEIGSKALSAGINDSGTAMEVMTRIGRILSAYKSETAQEPETRLENLYIAPIDPADLIEDGFAALSRDGADKIEVQLILQKIFAGLMHHPDPGLQDAVQKAACTELTRALAALAFEPDRARLKAAVAPDLLKAAQGQT